jgi:peptidoglycan/xylan/chitin deacetylase (PgdA/CDA1 family)
MIPIFRRWTRNNGRVLYEVQTDRPIIALTIDDGPDSQTTPQILDLLAQHDAQATFFLLANRVELNDELVARITTEGHELGNHLIEDQPSILHSVEEFRTRLDRAHTILSQYGEIKWFRPGSGLYSREMLNITEQAGYKTVLGSIYPFDSHIPSPWFASRFILSQAKPGAVIVLHDVGPRGERTVQTLSIVLPKLIERGYRIETLSGLTTDADS